MRAGVVGAGYVGACTAVVLAERGHDVALADIDRARVRGLAAGKAPFHEPGLDAALRSGLGSKRLTLTTDVPAATRVAEIVLLCVGTPSRRDGTMEKRFVRDAAATVGRALEGRRDYPVVAVKSTVLPGTTETVVAPALERGGTLRVGRDLGLAATPEFLREGSALHDARKPDRLIVGAGDARSADRLRQLYSGFDCPTIVTSPRTAEMIKYASNAFLAARISLANETANLCRALGVDVYEVMAAVGLDPRIGSEFLRAGAGFGGSCFPKDLSALLQLAKEKRAPSAILRATLGVNARQPLQTLKLAREALGSLRGKRVALLGLAFKAETDDVRETRALPIYRALRKAGARVVCYDPVAGANFRALAGKGVELAKDVRAALRGADCAIVQTEWSEFKTLPPEEFRSLMARPIVVDGRRTFDPELIRLAGVTYLAIGRGTTPQGR